MDVKNNIVALLQPLASPGNDLPINNKPGFEKKDNFSDVLEEATTKVNEAKDNAENKTSKGKDNAEAEENSQASEVSKETKSSEQKETNDRNNENVSDTKETDDRNYENVSDTKETDDRNYENVSDTKETDDRNYENISDTTETPSAQENPSATQKPTETKAPITTEKTENTQDDIVQQLQTLGLEPEEIQAFLNLFQANDTGVASDDFLEALESQLNLIQKTTEGGKLPLGITENSNLSSLKAREKLAADYLRSVGVENKEAANLARNMIQVKTGETNSFDQITDETKTTSSYKSLEALLGFLKQPKQTDVVKTDKVSKLEKAALTQQVRTDEKLKTASRLEAKSIETAGLAAPRIQTQIPSQDPLAKIFEQVQFQVDSTEEGGLKPIQPGFQNFGDNGPSLDLGTPKNSVEFMIQNSAKITENFSSALNEAKSTTASKALPNGVSEKNVVDQVVQKFTIKGTDNDNEIKIKLDPPALGKVRMNINTSGDSVKTTIIVENQGVKQAIEANLNQIKDSFTNQGMKIESFEVMVGGERGFKEKRDSHSQGSNFANSNRSERFDQEPLESNLVGAYSSRYDIKAGGVSVIV